jgi:hypothetical protein
MYCTAAARPWNHSVCSAVNASNPGRGTCALIVRRRPVRSAATAGRREGPWLLIVDGLDEVADPAQLDRQVEDDLEQDRLDQVMAGVDTALNGLPVGGCRRCECWLSKGQRQGDGGSHVGGLRDLRRHCHSGPSGAGGEHDRPENW